MPSQLNKTPPDHQTLQEVEAIQTEINKPETMAVGIVISQVTCAVIVVYYKLK